MAGNTKRGIYFGEPLRRLVDERADPQSGFRTASSIVNAVADRYLEIVRRSVPTLAVNEWCLIFDALNGVWTQDRAALYVQGLLQEVADHVALNGADKKWEIDGAALLRKLRDCTYCQLVAIVDAAERFWARDDWPQERRAMVSAVVGERAVE